MKRHLFLATVVVALPFAAAAQKVTYDEQVLPIFKNQCLKCHNPDKAKADLDLATYGAVMKGGSSGVIVKSGDPDGSALVKVITHAGEPTMPPNSKLPDKDIDLIKKWVAGGLLENSGSKAIVSNRPKIDLSLSAAAFGKPEGAPPMPGDTLLEPVLRTPRTSVATAVAASPWAPLVALGGQKQILLYNTETLQLAGVLPFPEGFAHDAKFSRNGKLLIVGGGRDGNKGLAAVWDVTTGERIITVGDELDVALAADISSNQKWIALGGPDRLVKIFSTATGQQVFKIKKHTDWVMAAEFNHTSTFLATGDRSGGIVVWEVATGLEEQSFVGHKSAIVSLAWRTPDVLVSASEDGSVRTWSMKEGQQVKSSTAHNSVLGMALDTQGGMVTCGRDKAISVWDKEGSKVKTFTITNDLPVRAVLSHDGKRVVAVDWTGRTYAWEVATGTELSGISLNPPPIAEQQELLAKQIAQFEAALPKLQAKLAEANTAAAKAKGDLDAAKTDAARKALAKTVESANKAVSEAKAVLERADADLKRCRPGVERLQLGAFYAQIWRAKVDLAVKRDDQKRLLSRAEAAKDSITQTEADIKAAKKIAAKTKEEREKIAKRIMALGRSIQATKMIISASKLDAEKMTKLLADEEQRIQGLNAEYQRQKAASVPVPLKAAKL